MTDPKVIHIQLMVSRLRSAHNIYLNPVGLSRYNATLSAANIRGYDRTVAGHLAAAFAVVSGEADCCVATRSAALAYGLDFVPLHRERYDFVLRGETLRLPQARAFLDVLQRSDLRRKLETLAGHDTTKTGAVLD